MGKAAQGHRSSCPICGLLTGNGYAARAERVGNIEMCSFCSTELHRAGWLWASRETQHYILILDRSKVRAFSVSPTWVESFFKSLEERDEEGTCPRAQERLRYLLNKGKEVTLKEGDGRGSGLPRVHKRPDIPARQQTPVSV